MKKIALTFDDGPNLEAREIFDILQRYNAKATFFLWGEKISGYENVLTDLIASGHWLANHTWTHPSLLEVDDTKVVEEIVKTDQAIFDITGVETTLFRPPYGHIDKRVEELIQKKIVLWSADSRDWSGILADEIVDNVIKESKNQAILLMHCFPETVKALPRILEFLQRESYTFVSVDDVLK